MFLLTVGSIGSEEVVSLSPCDMCDGGVTDNLVFEASVPSLKPQSSKTISLEII